MTEAELLKAVTERLCSFEQSVFRLEALDHYTSDAEDEDLRRWLAGERVTFASEDEYFSRVRAARVAGKTWCRVHAVTGPTPYVRFEVEGYAENEEAGEDVRILQAADLQSVFGEQPPDFWLFDDAIVLEMQYDAAGRIAAIPVITDPDRLPRYCRLRDIALHNAVPVGEYRAALRRQQVPAPNLAISSPTQPVEAA